MWTFLLQTRGEREEEEEEEEKEEGREGGEGKRKRERGRGREKGSKYMSVHVQAIKILYECHIIFPLTFTLESLSDKTQHVTGTEVAFSGRGIRVNREGVTMNCPFTF